jgi:prophage regulatory protein
MTDAYPGTGVLPEPVTAKEITRWLGLSRERVDALVLEGEFPRPIRVGMRRKAWVKADLMNWLAKRQAADRCTSNSKKLFDDASNIVGPPRG